MRVTLSVAAAAGLAVSALPLCAGGQEARQISVVAKKYEFSPQRIEVKAGDSVEITFRSEDTAHGFVSKDLGLKKVIFEKGKPATVRLTPEKPGTYRFRCAKFCGFGHLGMKGEIVVTP